MIDKIIELNNNNINNNNINNINNITDIYSIDETYNNVEKYYYLLMDKSDVYKPLKMKRIREIKINEQIQKHYYLI